MNILDLVFPKWCVGCGKIGKYVCERCQIGMNEEEQICPGCGRRSRYGLRHGYCKSKGNLDGVTCFWAYEGVVKKLIAGAKYKHYFDFLGEIVMDSFSMADRDEFFYLRKFVETKPVVVPIPLYKRRERERGFNQADIICHLVGSIWHLKTEKLLVRIRDTGQQVGRTREERLVVMKGAFATSPQAPLLNKERGILLVDDVWTTGATMQECAYTLKKAGFEKVWGIVLAR